MGDFRAGLATEAAASQGVLPALSARHEAASLLLLFARALQAFGDGRTPATTRLFLRALSDGAQETFRRAVDRWLLVSGESDDSDAGSFLAALQQLAASFLYFEAGLAALDDGETSEWAMALRKSGQCAGDLLSRLGDRLAGSVEEDTEALDEAFLRAEEALRALSRTAVSTAKTPQMAAARLQQRDRFGEGLHQLRDACRDLAEFPY